MPKPKLIRITTVPLSLDKLLEGQLGYMSGFYEVVAVSSDSDGLRKVAEREGVRYHEVPFTRKITPLQDLRALWNLYRFLRQEMPLIVHTHTPKAGLLGMMAAYLARIPIRLHTVAGLPWMESKGFKRWLLVLMEKVTYRCATRIYPNSRGLFEFILSKKLTPAEKLKIIGIGSSNGIDLAYFDPKNYPELERVKLRSNLGIPSTAFVFSFIGRLVKDKGVQELVQAFIEVSKDYPSAHLLLIGPLEPHLDPLESKTTTLIKEHPRIHSLGYQEDIRPFLAMSDVFVFPSYREGYPNAVMQALAMEVPVIATQINGCNELVVQGENGWLIPPKDELSLEHRLKYVLAHPEILIPMKGNTRSGIEKDLKREIIWSLLNDEYQNRIQEIS